MPWIHHEPGALAAGGLLVLVALVASTPAAAEVFPHPIHRQRLDNGLEVIAVPMQSPGVVTYFTLVRTGSRDEVEAGHSGFAHFFEHMMFRGTQTYPSDVYNDILKRMGADTNAFTSDDLTGYYITGPAAELETMFRIESDRFQNLEYGEAAFRTEALAVLGEYNKNASSPFLPMYERLRELAFDRHTYRHTTMGFLEDIQAMPGYYEYSLSFFDRFYRPENCILLVVGDVDPEGVFTLARQHYGDWQPGYQSPDVQTEGPPTGPHEAQIAWPSPIQPNLMIGYRAPAFTTDGPESAALDIIGQLLFAESAPLYQKLMVEKQWVDDLDGGYVAHRDPYLFMIRARVIGEERIDDVRATIRQALEGLAERPVDAERLERVKSHLRYSFALQLDTPQAVAFTLAEFLALTGEPESIDRLYRRYDEIGPEEIQTMAARVFTETGRTTVLLTHRPGTASEEGD